MLNELYFYLMLIEQIKKNNEKLFIIWKTLEVVINTSKTKMK